MVDVSIPNYLPQSTTHQFSAVWELTRGMKAAGYSYLASANGTTKDTSAISTNDLWGATATPLTEAYPTALDGVAAWWCAQGPTTLKINMTVAPTGNFIRGEKVTQATSGAEGELLGFDFDNVSVGHAVIMPHTGTFDGTHIITGSVSGATFTATAVDSYVMQVVISKNTTINNGSMYIQRCSVANESASQFSTLAVSAGCTATVSPGGTGTGNVFPTVGTYVTIGMQNGSVVGGPWFNGIGSTYGKAQIFVANCTPAAGVSADGTFQIMIGDTAQGVGTGIGFWSYTRMDDTEDADLDPYLFIKAFAIQASSANARTDGTTSGQTVAALASGTASPLTTSTMVSKGWRRRGFPTNDAFNTYIPCLLAMSQSAGGAIVGSVILADSVSNPETVACSYTTKKLRERIWYVSQDNTKKHRKGTARWIWGAQGGVTFDTLDSKLKIAIGTASSINSNVFDNITLYALKYDGSSVPTQT